MSDQMHIPHEYMPTRMGKSVVLPTALAWTIVVAVLVSGVWIGSENRELKGQITLQSAAIQANATLQTATLARIETALTDQIADVRQEQARQRDINAAFTRSLHALELRIRERERSDP